MVKKNHKLLSNIKNRLFLKKPIFARKKFLSLVGWFGMVFVFLILGSYQLKTNQNISLLKVVKRHQLIEQKQEPKFQGNFFISYFSKTFQPFNSEFALAANNSSIFDSFFLIPIQNPNNLTSPGQKTNIFTYIVRRGDTLSRIAKKFSISLSTILSANHLKSRSIIRPGMKLTILPVTGILYIVQNEDSLNSISKKFNISIKDLKRFNHLKDDTVSPGQTLTIPGIVQRIKESSQNEEQYKNLPDLKKYFSWPCEGLDHRFIHPKNAVDISNVCGTKIFAAQEGLVIEAKKGFNKGYGNYITIQHPNGTQTLYAYLRDILVKEGQYVKKGQLIGTMGNSGQPENVKGCHLHFEVYGAKNFLAE